MTKIQYILCITGYLMISGCDGQLLKYIDSFLQYYNSKNQSCLYYPPFLDEGFDGKSITKDQFDKEYRRKGTEKDKRKFIIQDNKAAIRNANGDVEFIGDVINYTVVDEQVIVDGVPIHFDVDLQYMMYNGSLVLINNTKKEEPPLQLLASRRVAMGSSQMADLENFPFAITLKMRYFHRFQYHYRMRLWRTFCSATLIKPEVVLTATICLVSHKAYVTVFGGKRFRLRGKSLQHIRVVAAFGFSETFDLPSSEKHGQWRHISKFYHPEAFLYPFYDVGIIEVNESFDMTLQVYSESYPFAVTVAEIPKDESDYMRHPCLIFGHGTFHGQDFTSHLKYESMTLFDCDYTLGVDIHETDYRDFLCAKSSDDRHAVVGDTGSGLICSSSDEKTGLNKTYLVGILIGTAQSMSGPMVFTNLVRWRDFVYGSSTRLEISFYCIITALLVQIIAII